MLFDVTSLGVPEIVSVVPLIVYITPFGRSVTFAVCAPFKSKTIEPIDSPSQILWSIKPLTYAMDGFGFTVITPDMLSSLQLLSVVVMV